MVRGVVDRYMVAMVWLMTMVAMVTVVAVVAVVTKVSNGTRGQKGELLEGWISFIQKKVRTMRCYGWLINFDLVDLTTKSQGVLFSSRWFV